MIDPARLRTLIETLIQNWQWRADALSGERGVKIRQGVEELEALLMNLPAPPVHGHEFKPAQARKEQP